MGMRVELTDEERDELYRLRAIPVKTPLKGRCAECNKGIPHGYIAMVTKWQVVQPKYGSVYLRPVEMWCRDCGISMQKRGLLPKVRTVRGGHSHHEEATESGEQMKALDPREVAKKLYGVMAKDEPFGSKKLARLAGLEYEDRFVKILQKIAETGKIVFEEGKWRRA